MSGPDPHLPDDRELEDFLAGRGPHRARYRAASAEQAPAALDAAVLAQAQAAVAAAPSRKVVPIKAWERWRLPLSLAATLVIGVGLSLRVQREAAMPPPSAAAASREVESVFANDALETGNGASAEIAAAPVVASAPPPPPKPPPPAAEKPRAREPELHEPVIGLAEREAAFAAKAAESRKSESARADVSMAEPAVAAAPPPAAPPPAPVAKMYSEPEVAAAGAAPMPQAADRVAPASPPIAAAMAAPRAEVLAKRRAPSASALPALVFAAGDYRSEAGNRLLLLADRSFQLIPAGAMEPLHRGNRVAVEDGEHLLNTAAGEACLLKLRATARPDVIELLPDCAGALAGIYRRQ